MYGTILINSELVIPPLYITLVDYRTYSIILMNSHTYWMILLKSKPSWNSNEFSYLSQVSNDLNGMGFDGSGSESVRIISLLWHFMTNSNGLSTCLSTNDSYWTKPQKHLLAPRSPTSINKFWHKESENRHSTTIIYNSDIPKCIILIIYWETPDKKGKTYFSINKHADNNGNSAKNMRIS